MAVPKPKVSNEQASERTKQRRATGIEGIPAVICGGPEHAIRMTQ